MKKQRSNEKRRINKSIRPNNILSYVFYPRNSKEVHSTIGNNAHPLNTEGSDCNYVIIETKTD